MISAPRHLRPGQESIKKACVQLVEDLLQVISVATSRMDSLAAAYLPHQVSLLGDIVAGNISAIAACVLPFYGTAVHLGQKNMRNRGSHRWRCTFQQIGQTHQ